MGFSLQHLFLALLLLYSLPQCLPKVVRMDLSGTLIARSNVPRRMYSSVDKRASQTVNGFSAGYYTLNVTLGTPPQPFSLLLDSSSANVWVVDAACTSVACTGDSKYGVKHRQFHTERSTTFRNLSLSFQTGSMVGSIGGQLAQDYLGFAGFNVKQEFGLVEQLPDFYSQMPFDGTFGLAWPSLAVDAATPPIQNVLSQLDKPLFSVWLGSKAVGGSANPTGAVTYGGLDNDHCDSHWNYLPLSSLSYWQFEISGFRIRSSTFTRRQQVDAATGAPWLYGPPDQIAAIVKITHAKEYYGLNYVDCTNGLPTLPELVFTAGGRDYVVPGSAYLDPTKLQLGSSGQYQCQLRIFAVTGSGFGPQWHLGTPFLQTFCSAFDVGGKRIGFAKTTAH